MSSSLPNSYVLKLGLRPILNTSWCWTLCWQKKIVLYTHVKLLFVVSFLFFFQQHFNMFSSYLGDRRWSWRSKIVFSRRICKVILISSDYEAHNILGNLLRFFSNTIFSYAKVETLFVNRTKIQQNRRTSEKKKFL